MATYETGSLVLPDGTELARHCWFAENPPEKTILIVHGYAEHGGRYARLAQALVDRGFRVEAYDHRGHGLSQGHPVLITDYRQLVDDLQQVVAQVRPKRGPFFIFGHSMGGGLLAHYAARFDPEVDGLIFSSPAIRVVDPPSVLLRLVSRLSARLMPKGAVPAFFYHLDAATISRLPAEVAAYEGDPLVHRGPLLNGTGWALTRMMDEILPLMKQLRGPMLILHGDDDRLVDPHGSRLLAQDAGAEDLTHKTYEGGYHELFNDECRVAVTRDLLDWLANRGGT